MAGTVGKPKSLRIEVHIWRSGPQRISISLEREKVVNVGKTAGSAYEGLDKFLKSHRL